MSWGACKAPQFALIQMSLAFLSSAFLGCPLSRPKGRLVEVAEVDLQGFPELPWIPKPRYWLASPHRCSDLWIACELHPLDPTPQPGGLDELAMGRDRGASRGIGGWGHRPAALPPSPARLPDLLDRSFFRRGWGWGCDAAGPEYVLVRRQAALVPVIYDVADEVALSVVIRIALCPFPVHVRFGKVWGRTSAGAPFG